MFAQEEQCTYEGMTNCLGPLLVRMSSYSNLGRNWLLLLPTSQLIHHLAASGVWRFTLGPGHSHRRVK